MTEHVYVLSVSVDHEPGWIVGVTATLEAAKDLAQGDRGPRRNAEGPIVWRESVSASGETGWGSVENDGFGRFAGYEIERWEVTR